MKSKLLLVAVVGIGILVAIGFFAFTSIKDSGDGATGAVTGTEPETVEEEATGDLSQIKEGMTKDELLELAGEPVEKQTVSTPSGNTITYWYFEEGKDVYQVAIDEGEVTAVRIY